MSATPEFLPPTQSPPPAGGDPTRTQVSVTRWTPEGTQVIDDWVAEELPVALVYNGVPHIVMLATPAHLEELALGFTLSEALIDRADEITSLESSLQGDSAEVRIGIVPSKFSELLRRQRNLTGRTGCGLCGAETIEQAIRNPAAVSAGVRVPVSALHAALQSLPPLQALNSSTGSIHGAAWVDANHKIQLVREDVGRHNALDKCIGASIHRKLALHTGYAIITSRASYEMVQKAATVGITMLVAVSAPTAMAIRLAQRAGMTLVGFARADRHVVYSHPERLYE